MKNSTYSVIIGVNIDWISLRVYSRDWVNKAVHELCITVSVIRCQSDNRVPNGSIYNKYIERNSLVTPPEIFYRDLRVGKRTNNSYLLSLILGRWFWWSMDSGYSRPWYWQLASQWRFCAVYLDLVRWSFNDIEEWVLQTTLYYWHQKQISWRVIHVIKSCLYKTMDPWT